MSGILIWFWRSPKSPVGKGLTQHQHNPLLSLFSHAMDMDHLPNVGEVGRKPEYCAKFHGAASQFPLISALSAGDVFSPNCSVEIFWIDWWSLTGSSHHFLSSHSPWGHKGKRDHPHPSLSLDLIPASHASIQIRKQIKNTKKYGYERVQKRRILITPSGVQWGVTEQHQCVREDFSPFYGRLWYMWDTSRTLCLVGNFPVLSFSTRRGLTKWRESDRRSGYLHKHTHT